MTTEIELKNIIKKHVSSSIEIENLDLENSIEDFGVDSSNYIRIIIEIEGNFGIRFENEHLLFKKYITLKELISYVQKKLNAEK